MIFQNPRKFFQILPTLHATCQFALKGSTQSQQRKRIQAFGLNLMASFTSVSANRSLDQLFSKISFSLPSSSSLSPLSKQIQTHSLRQSNGWFSPDSLASPTTFTSLSSSPTVLRHSLFASPVDYCHRACGMFCTDVSSSSSFPLFALSRNLSSTVSFSGTALPFSSIPGNDSLSQRDSGLESISASTSPPKVKKSQKKKAGPVSSNAGDQSSIPDATSSEENLSSEGTTSKAITLQRDTELESVSASTLPPKVKKSRKKKAGPESSTSEENLSEGTSGKETKQKGKRKEKDATVGSKSASFVEYKRARKEELASASESGLEGSIHLIFGPMFAGKTTELLQRVAWEQSEGRKVALVKSSIDTRYDKAAVVSHNGLKMPCMTVNCKEDLKEMFDLERLQEVDVIAVDEAQFIRGLSEWCMTAVDVYKKTVLIAGLDGDFQRKRFGDVVEMVPVAESVTKLSANCRIEGCSRRAHFTFRKSGDMTKEVVGGEELYMPVCRAHYGDRVRTMEALKVMEAQFQEEKTNGRQFSLDDDIGDSQVKVLI